MLASADYMSSTVSSDSTLLKLYRQLPWFKGKLRIGKLLFSRSVNSSDPMMFTAHHNIVYKIPNTLENIGVELLINGVYERDIVKFLLNHVDDNNVFFDIGANIGSVALPVLKKKRNIIYYGFEASPRVFNYLDQNIRLNTEGEVNLCNNLVHSDNALAVPFYEADLYGKSSMAPTYTNKSIQVRSVSLDHYCSESKVDRINWMKVDVQGFELFVFRGMERLLRERRVENILFESEAWADEQAGIPAGSAQQYLCDAGYLLYGIDGKLLNVSKKQNETMIWARLK